MHGYHLVWLLPVYDGAWGTCPSAESFILPSGYTVHACAELKWRERPCIWQRDSDRVVLLEFSDAGSKHGVS
ncbi:hypothetical protein EDD15DRAFT_2227576, partial [Pisolithus albus]